jgi:hypothetical protein
MDFLNPRFPQSNSTGQQSNFNMADPEPWHQPGFADHV